MYTKGIIYGMQFAYCLHAFLLLYSIYAVCTSGIPNLVNLLENLNIPDYSFSGVQANR